MKDFKIFAQFDENGFAVGFYDSRVNENIPDDVVEITVEQHAELFQYQGFRKWVDGEVVEYTPPPPPPPVIEVPSVTLWERMTDVEAEQVNAAMATQPFRTRQIFLTANTFRSDHELWPLLVQMATDLFGETRAAELLADPSELVANS